MLRKSSQGIVIARRAPIPHPVLVKGMRGLGDNLYQRPFIRALLDQDERRVVYLDTPWPQLYADMPVRFVRPQTKLRTQQKNLASLPAMKYWPPAGRPSICKIRYGETGIAEGMTACFGVGPARMTLPPLGKNPLAGLHPYVLVRPVTVRREWQNEARNPLPQYVAQAVEKFRAQGYKVVSVADLQDGEEWALDPLPRADVELHRGELDVKSLLAVSRDACAIIGGVGWIVPFAIASNVPTLVIVGGNGGYNSPHLISRGFATAETPIHFATPKNFCLCKEKIHDCDKRIDPHLFAAITRGVLIDADPLRARVDLDARPRDRLLPGAADRLRR